MGKLREKRNASKAEANSDKIPRIEIELAGLAQDLGDLETYITETIDGTDEVTASGLKVNVFRLNAQEMSNSYTIPTGKSAMCVGPVTVPEGKRLIVPEGSRLVIL